MPFAELGDVKLFYTDEGSGDRTLLFVHGYSCDSHDWSWQLPFFVQHQRVIAVDLRGHGRSSAPAAGYSAIELAHDLRRLLHLLKVEEVIAFGHSMGGVVVSALAVEEPALVAALVCVDPAYLQPDNLLVGLEPVFAALQGENAQAVVQRMFDGMDPPDRSMALRTWHGRRALGVEPHVLRQAFESQVRGLALTSNSHPYLARRSCPVLSFYADSSRCELESAVFGDERSRCIGWEGAGHWLHQERPGEFNAVAAAWIASLFPA